MEEEEYQTLREAEDTHWWFAGLHDLVTRTVAREAARAGRPLRMLEAGCGTGRLAALLREFGDIEACDLHPRAIEAAVRRGFGPVRRCDLSADDLGTDRYDLVTCIDVLYHRAVRDEVAALANLRRALRPGGLLLLQLPAFECLRGAHDLAVHTRRRYRRGEVARLLRVAGFVVDTATYRLFALFLPALVWRRVSSRGARPAGTPASDVTRLAPGALNGLMARAAQWENRLIAAGWSFPLGTSVFAMARKPAPAQA